MPLLTLQELEQMTPLFRGRVGNMVGRSSMRLLAINKLNALYDRHAHLCGPRFAHSVLQDLGVAYDVYAERPEVMPLLEKLRRGEPFISISNHPYGGIDGVVLADFFGNLCPNYKIIVNKVLGRVEALSSSFISVTPTGVERTAPTAESVLGIRRALAHLRSGGSLGLFPSGAVSDFRLRSCSVRDREWQHPIIRFIAKARVPIVPVHFLDGNSWFYYALGLIDWRIRLLRLPAELFNKRGRPVGVAIGAAISVEEQQKYLATHSVEEFGLWLRGRVYGMSIG